MGDYIDFTLSSSSFDRIIEVLEKTCESSDDFLEIEECFNLIKHLENQKDEYYSKFNDAIRKEYGLK